MSDIPEPNPESETSISRELDKEHIRPADTFQGKPLWPFSKGTKLVYMQVTDDDTVLFRALAFIWIHLRRTEQTAKADLTRHVIPVAWNINQFRGEIMEFRETLSDEDEADAIRIMTECFDRDKKTEIKAGALDGSTTQKKTVPTPAPLLGVATS